jgi:hypothetical protein
LCRVTSRSHAPSTRVASCRVPPGRSTATPYSRQSGSRRSRRRRPPLATGLALMRRSPVGANASSASLRCSSPLLNGSRRRAPSPPWMALLGDLAENLRASPVGRAGVLLGEADGPATSRKEGPDRHLARRRHPRWLARDGAGCGRTTCSARAAPGKRQGSGQAGDSGQTALCDYEAPDHERGQASLPMGRRAQAHQQPSHDGQTGYRAVTGLNDYASARLD